MTDAALHRRAWEALGRDWATCRQIARKARIHYRHRARVTAALELMVREGLAERGRRERDGVWVYRRRVLADGFPGGFPTDGLVEAYYAKDAARG